MAEPEDMIMPMLREMRAQMREAQAGFEAFRKEVHADLDEIKRSQKNIRHALTADTMMSKFITGDFEDRITALEEKVDALAKDR
ncbi:MAG: hypothetical protein JJ920_15590 [Roseitalea sp.]|nr:hypothetical protein [Roseitalea sp.]MBO6722333.1 hypothetical protein [Roseitalea sp.]MBO6744336.1 hypothetical protein [Roseitalea sp.]NER83399.1 hypothetical protein [Leptolyngbya sp. SIO1D8]